MGPSAPSYLRDAPSHSLPHMSSLPPFLLLPSSLRGSDQRSPWAGFSYFWSWGQEETFPPGHPAYSPPISQSPELLAHRFTQHPPGPQLCVTCQKAQLADCYGAHTTALLIPRVPLQPFHLLTVISVTQTYCSFFLYKNGHLVFGV